MLTTTIIELDDRRRVALGKVGRPQDRRYLVTQHPDGTLVLEPAVVMSETEARFLTTRPDAMAHIAAARADHSTLVRRPARRR
jgi:hypothetical protein